MKDFECSCGKKPINLQRFCPNCDVEFTYSKKRRYQLGFIRLFNSIVHVWYLKGRPSYLSILLNLSRRQSESLVYCTDSILNSIFPNSFNVTFYQSSWSDFNSELKYRNLKSFKKILFSKFSQQSSIQRQIEVDKFFLHLSEFSVSPSKGSKDLSIYEPKQLDHSKSNFPRNININSRFFNNHKKRKKRVAVLSRLENFLKSSKYWALGEKRSLVSKFKNNQLSKKRNLENVGFGNKNFQKFVSSYYSISKYFCWEESINSTYFVYYMTNLPSKLDKIIPYYSRSTLQQLNKPNIYIGAQFFSGLLNQLSYKSKISNLLELERQIRIQLFEITEFSARGDLLECVKLLRRLKLIWYFRRTKNQPIWMILSILPVLPPDLRPIVQLEGNQIAISDLNKLYQKVLFRNRRIQKLKVGHYSNNSEEMQYAQRLLQEAVDCLIENGKGGISPSSTLNNRPLKSLSDILKGKKGRFRQNLLGKRVDYSGRSVIVVGPHLKIHECGIPKEMALELFQPFLIRSLLLQKKARTIQGAKRLIENGGNGIYQLLSEIIKNYPVLLNRAPTLHRLSIQSFQPKLVDGRAIILHPSVCSSFNADFDGDQMAVHIPLSYQARSEAWKLLWSQNNILSPATGQPTLMPTQDMILGWYYLTAYDPKDFYTKLLKSIKKPITISIVKKLFQVKRISKFYKFKKFTSKSEVFLAYNQKQVDIHTPIWLVWKNFFEIEQINRSLLEMQLSPDGEVFMLSGQFLLHYNWYGFKIGQFLFTTPGRVIFNDLVKRII